MADNANRIDIEWLVINALRENFSLINESESVSYNETIRFAQENFKELFQHDESYFGRKRTISHEFEKYEQEALARSRKEKKNIKVEALIQERITSIESLITSPENKKQQFNILKNERKRLLKLLQENQPSFTPIDENQALLNDFSINRPGLNYRDSYAGKYNVYKTKSGRQFILRFLHPGPAESATGVDLVYEIFDKKNKTVRIIAIQYKTWRKKTLYFSQEENLNSQLERATNCFCNKGFCAAPDEKKIHYRLPFCTPFLRPTDKIYNTSNLLTSGWHIPVCQINGKVTYSSQNGKMLTLDKIKEVSLGTEEFEKLFQQEKIGSRWLTIKEVEKFYRENKVLENDGNIIIFTQSKKK